MLLKDLFRIEKSSLKGLCPSRPLTVLAIAALLSPMQGIFDQGGRYISNFEIDSDNWKKNRDILRIQTMFIIRLLRMSLNYSVSRVTLSFPKKFYEAINFLTAVSYRQNSISSSWLTKFLYISAGVSNFWLQPKFWELVFLKRFMENLFLCLLLSTYMFMRVFKFNTERCIYTFMLLCTMFIYCLGLMLPAFHWRRQASLWTSEHHTLLCFGNCLAGKIFSHADHILQGPHVSYVTHFELRSSWYLYGIF